MEWCDRRLLARIHRYTINRLRAEIEAVTAADFMRFLLHWQHVSSDQQVNGVEGLAAVIEQLDGYELAASAWEHDVLPARVRDYTSSYIDMLCLSGRVAWGRTTPADGASKAPLKTSPIALLVREHAALWRASSEAEPEGLSSSARTAYDALRSRGNVDRAAVPSGHNAHLVAGADRPVRVARLPVDDASKPDEEMVGAGDVEGERPCDRVLLAEQAGDADRIIADRAIGVKPN